MIRGVSVLLQDYSLESTGKYELGTFDFVSVLFEPLAKPRLRV
jgi:hypothetical protein